MDPFITSSLINYKPCNEYKIQPKKNYESGMKKCYEKAAKLVLTPRLEDQHSNRIS